MSQHSISQTLWLRNRPFSLRNAQRPYSTDAPLTPRYNVLPTPHCADARAIASDFFIAGNDMRAALSVWPYTIDFCRASRSAGMVQHTQFHQGSLPRPEDFDTCERVLRRRRRDASLSGSQSSPPLFD